MYVDKTDEVFDYGCGKGTLNENLDINIKEYDPAITGKEAPPQPADVVMCTDVLEHIEPECLNAVFKDLARVVKRHGFFTIATREARKVLPDGRNAHLIIQPPEWWLEQLAEHFTIVHTELNASTTGELAVIVTPKGEANETYTRLHRI